MARNMTRTTAARPARQLPDFLDDGETAAAAPAVDVGHAPDDAGEAAATASAPATARGAWFVAAAGLVGAAAFAIWPAAATATGIAPGALLACAAAFAAAAATQGRVARELAQLAATAHAQRAELAELHAQVATGRDAAPGGSGDLDQVMLALQKQDEKTSNLSRAVKMYGQPLVEISGQTTEIATLAQQLQQRVAELAARPATPGFEPLAQALGRIEVNLAAVAQRLDDAEARKALFRLEEATQKGLAALADLRKGDDVRQVGADLQARIDRATATLADSINRLGETSVGELAVVTRDIQREVTGVATQVAQINAAVKSGARLDASAAPAPTATATAAAPSPATGPAPSSPAPTADGGVAPSNGGGGGYQTGARSSSGRNVLGAIARLKQMKG